MPSVFFPTSSSHRRALSVKAWAFGVQLWITWLLEDDLHRRSNPEFSVLGVLSWHAYAK
ncbi:protein of unknown function [Burkholderia multivorans]